MINNQVADVFWVLLTSNKHIFSRTLLLERWSISMDWKRFGSINWTTLINWLSNDIDNSSKGSLSNWHLNWGSSILNSLSSDETLSRIQSNSTHIISSQMLSNFKYKSVLSVLNLKGIEDWWEFSGELHIHNGSNNLRDFTSSGTEGSCQRKKQSYHVTHVWVKVWWRFTYSE